MVFAATVPTEAVLECHGWLRAISVRVRPPAVGAASGRPNNCRISCRRPISLISPRLPDTSSATTSAAVVRFTALPLHDGRQHFIWICQGESCHEVLTVAVAGVGLLGNCV